jgi:hypothetical protein
LPLPLQVFILYKKHPTEINPTHVPGTNREQAHLPGIPTTVLPRIENYWEVSKSTDRADLIMMLRLFAYDSGKLTKCKEEQWAFIESKKLHQLSHARVDSKAEEYVQQIPQIQLRLMDIALNTEPAGDHPVTDTIEE